MNHGKPSRVDLWGLAGAGLLLVGLIPLTVLKYVSSDQSRVFRYSGNGAERLQSCFIVRTPGDATTLRPLASLGECIEAYLVDDTSGLLIGRFATLAAVLLVYFSAFRLARLMFSSGPAAAAAALALGFSPPIIFIGVIGLSGITVLVSLALSLVSTTVLWSLASSPLRSWSRTRLVRFLGGVSLYALSLLLFAPWSISAYLAIALLFVASRSSVKARVIQLIRVWTLVSIVLAIYVALVRVSASQVFPDSNVAAEYDIPAPSLSSLVARIVQVWNYSLGQFSFFTWYPLVVAGGLAILVLSGKADPANPAGLSIPPRATRTLLNVVVLVIGIISSLLAFAATQVEPGSWRIPALWILNAAALGAIVQLAWAKLPWKALRPSLAMAILWAICFVGGWHVLDAALTRSVEYARIREAVEFWLSYPDGRDSLVLHPGEFRRSLEMSYSSSAVLDAYSETSSDPGDINRFFPIVDAAIRDWASQSDDRTPPRVIEFTWDPKSAFAHEGLSFTVSTDLTVLCSERAFAIDLRSGAFGGLPPECSTQE